MTKIFNFVNRMHRNYGVSRNWTRELIKNKTGKDADDRLTLKESRELEQIISIRVFGMY